MDSFFLSFSLIQSTWDNPLYISRVTCYKFQKNIVFLYEDLFFTLTNNVDSDEMPNTVAFHLGLQSL